MEALASTEKMLQDKVNKTSKVVINSQTCPCTEKVCSLSRSDQSFPLLHFIHSLSSLSTFVIVFICLLLETLLLASLVYWATLVFW